jgi:SAM-dependent methyltransferase
MPDTTPSNTTPAAEDAPVNRDQHDYWTQEGEHWVREADRYDAMNLRFGEAMLDAADLQAGEQVLDVGCGNGATTLAAAQRVRPGGSVVGVDLSATMLALARRRVDEAGCGNIELLEADAQVHPFERSSIDAVISRFGTMFFDDPAAAFTNLHDALKPGGRLAVVCWQDVFQSEWIIISGGAAAEHVGFPDFGPPGAPGPFALADENRLRGILEIAGFDDITIEGITQPMRIGDDAGDAIAFITSIELVRDNLFAGKPPGKVAAAVDAARAALAPYEGPKGVVMNGGAWLVSARH